MIRRRALMAQGLALAAAACAPRPLVPVAGPPLPPPSQAQPVPRAPQTVQRARATPGLVDEPALAGLDAIIDLHHASPVQSFAQARAETGILAVIHKASEGDWRDPRHDERRGLATDAGLLWGAYHFGTRQHPGALQARMFLDAARPDTTTLMVLDLELNARAPQNSMQLDQAEAFVAEIYTATGRLPVIYVHPAWADGEASRGVSLGGPIRPGTLTAACDLWLADYRDGPELPSAWAGHGWRLWQYAGDVAGGGGPFRDRTRMVAGIARCDRNLFAGTREQLIRYWTGGFKA